MFFSTVSKDVTDPANNKFQWLIRFESFMIEHCTSVLWGNELNENCILAVRLLYRQLYQQLNFSKMAKRTLDELIGESTMPVFIDFYADWCGPCHSIAPSIIKLAQEFSGRLTVVKINVDKQPEAASRYQVQGIPALMLFDKGSVIWRTSGALAYPRLKAEVSKALGWD